MSNSTRDEADEPLLHPQIHTHVGLGDVPLQLHELEGQKLSDHGVWEESIRLLSLAGPLLIGYVASFTLQVIAAIFVGHLDDPTILSGAFLAGSFYNVTGLSIIVGLSAGMETLCGQAYGAKNYGMLGVVLQRAVLICFLACVPITLLWLNVEWLLIHLHQPQEVVAVASRYLHQITPVLWMSVTSGCIQRYLMAQQIVAPIMFISLATTLVSPAYYWYFITWLDLGLGGAALALNVAQATSTACYLLYFVAREVWMRHSPERTWHGFSWRALEGWGVYLQLAAPAAAMMCMEWWVFEVAVFLAGLLPNGRVAVGVMGVGQQVDVWFFMLPASLSSAVNTRVANHLGAGAGKAARKAFRTALGMTLALQVALASLTFFLRDQIAMTFTGNEEDLQLTRKIMPAVAVLLLADGSAVVLSGVLRGSGRQATGATVNLVSYWLFGLPLAAALAFYFHWGVLGFWVGLTAACFLQVTLYLIIIVNINWEKEVDRAKKLVRDHSEKDLQAALLADEDDDEEARGAYHYDPPSDDEDAARQHAALASIKATNGDCIIANNVEAGVAGEVAGQMIAAISAQEGAAPGTPPRAPEGQADLMDDDVLLPGPPAHFYGDSS